MAWLSGWPYRKSHEIQGSTAGAQTDYQVRVVVHYGAGADSGEDVYLNGKCRTDFGDIRFTDSDETTELDYWMEEYVDSDYAVFWVKIPSIPASPDTATIYIYYGKADATTTSNGFNTFPDLFDDFDDNSFDTSRWDEVDVGTGDAIEQNQRMELYVPADTDCAQIVTKNAINIQNRLIEVYLNNTVISEVGLVLSLTKPTGGWFAEPNWYMGRLYRSTLTNKFRFERKVDGSHTLLYGGSPISWSEKVQFRITNTTIKGFEQTTQRFSETYQLSSYNCYIGIKSRGLSGYLGTDWVDNILIRKYVDPEPSHGAWGTEETPPLIERFQEEGTDFRETKFGATWTS